MAAPATAATESRPFRPESRSPVFGVSVVDLLELLVYGLVDEEDELLELEDELLELLVLFVAGVGALSSLGVGRSSIFPSEAVMTFATWNTSLP
jgi:hypothetical protein